MVAVLIVCLLGAGVFIALIRSRPDEKGSKSILKRKIKSNQSVIRSWIAVALVACLIVLCGASFALGDTALRSSLIGALTVSVGSAVAYYFASRTGDAAGQALANSVAKEAVPSLIGLTEDAAAQLLGRTSFRLQTTAAPSTGSVIKQSPGAGQLLTLGSSVEVTLSG